jgi:flavin reductase (DIM6/NTAB) family NADH-FMN oxidoreductase RutF
VSFECRRFKQVEVGPERDLIIGEVIHIHARDGLIDPHTKRIADERYRPIGRLMVLCERARRQLISRQVHP